MAWFRHLSSQGHGLGIELVTLNNTDRRRNFMSPDRIFRTLGTILLVVVLAVVLRTYAWAGSEFKTLYTFTGGNDGRYSEGSLTFDQSGNLYGTTFSGGAYNLGAVFKLTPSPKGGWTEIVLHSFAGGGDGAGPDAGVIFDVAGSLYGTTSSGGASNAGTVFKLSQSDGSWTESVLYSFVGGKDGSLPRASVILAPAGNLYGTTYYGGRFGYGVVFQLTPNGNGSWKEHVLHDFANYDGSHPSGLILDQKGNLYGTTFAGGDLKCNPSFGCGAVFQLVPNIDGSWKENVLHRFTGKGGGYPMASLVFDFAGNLYGTTSWNDGLGFGLVFQLTPNGNGSWKEKVLYHFKGGIKGGSDGSYPTANLLFDKTGNLYGTTLHGGNFRYCVSVGCGIVFTLKPNSNGGWNETVLHRFLNRPGDQPSAGIVFDTAGNLYGTTSGDEVRTFGSVFEITP